MPKERKLLGRGRRGICFAMQKFLANHAAETVRPPHVTRGSKLSPKERRAAKHHLLHCTRCQRDLKEWESFFRSMNLIHEMMDRIFRRHAPELIEEARRWRKTS